MNSYPEKKHSVTQSIDENDLQLQARQLATALYNLLKSMLHVLAAGVRKLGNVELLLRKTEELTALTQHLRQDHDQLLNRLGDLGRYQQCLEQASARESRLSEEFLVRHVIEPLARMSLKTLQPIREARTQYRDGDPLEWANVHEIFLAQETILSEFLAVYGLEFCKSETGTPFDPGSMRPLNILATDQPDLDRTVARSLQPGLKTGNRLLEVEYIVLYRYEPAPVLKGTDS